MLEKILQPLEWLIFSLVSILAITGHLSIISKIFPFAFEIGIFILCLSLLLTILASLKNVSFRLSSVSTFGICSFAFALNHISLFSGTSSVIIPGFYYIVLIGSGLVSYKYSWIAPFFLFIIGEFVCKVLQLPQFDYLLIINELISYTQINYLSFIYLFISAFFPSFITSNLFEAYLKKSTSRVAAPVLVNRDTAQIDSKTQSVNQIQTSEFPVEIKNGNGIGSVNELLASVVYFMKRNFKAYSALGFIYDARRQCFDLNSFHSKSVNIKKNTSIPLGSGVIGKIAVDKKFFMSGELSYYNSGISYYGSHEEIYSILAVPVISEQNELLGALVIDSVDKFAFKDQDKDTLIRFSSLAAALITNARMRIFQEQAARTFQIFYKVSHQLTTALNISDVFDVIFQIAPSISHCTRQMAILFNEEKRVGMVYKIFGNYCPDISEGFEFPINAGLYSFAFKKRKAVNINDYSLYQSKYFRFSPDEQINPQLRSLLIFPILDDESRCRGLYSLESNTPNDFVGNIEQIFTTLIENASVAFTRALLYQRMERLATTDGLTGLNNHRHFQEILSKEIERTRRYGNFVSLLLMDIDHFKNFNDTYGHPVGDLVLKEIAACIRKSIRTNDIPARYGGEEFTVILPGTNEQGANRIAERIRSTIEGHIIISLDRQLRVTVSIGVASYPNMAKSQQLLIDNADKALYFSKENGRNRVSMYTPSMSGKE